MDNENTVQVADQPQQDETIHSSFLGTERLPSHADQTPEPAADEAIDDSQAALETEEEPTAELEAEATDETEESPSQDEWFKGLSQEENAYYAKRYPSLYNAYQDPNQPADLRQAFKDRVNQDRAWEERNRTAVKEEPTLEDEQDTDSQPDQTAQREQHYATVDSLVSSFDPKETEAFGKELLAAMGVDVSSNDPEVAAIVANAPKIGQAMSRRLVDGVMTLLQNPDVISRAIEARYPGTSENFERQQVANEWETVRSSNPAFAKLPAYGQKSGEFGQFMQKVMAENPFLQNMQFKGDTRQQARAFYSLAAELATKGQQSVTPAVVETAIKTGQRQAAEQSKKLAAGKALGAGRSNRTLDNSKDVSPMKRGYEIYKNLDQNVFD